VAGQDAAQDPIQVSPVAEQLQSGYPWLRFEPALETQYRAENYAEGLSQLRVNLAISLVLVLAFTTVDRLVLPASRLPVIDFVRYALLLPAVAIALGASFLTGAERWHSRLIQLLAPIVLAGIGAIAIVGSLQGTEILFSTLVLATTFTYFLVGLSFFQALRSNFIGLAAYVVGSAVAGMPVGPAAYNVMVLLFASVVGATVAYNVEHTRRTSWLEARLLAEMALRDGLTGIFNRRRFDDHIQRVWQLGIREHRPIAMLMIDIDFFKPYNDHYGHQAGDEVLKAVAGVMARSARRPLDFVARYGGEEFVIVLYDATRDYAAELARRIQDGVRSLGIPHAVSSASPLLTVSIGVAYVVPVSGRSPDGLVQLADEALYAAKNRGRNHVHVMEAEYAQLQTGSFRLQRKRGQGG
jgi:diguanylate cyclase (GGDEF)-like protein